MLLNDTVDDLRFDTHGFLCEYPTLLRGLLKKELLRLLVRRFGRAKKEAGRTWSGTCSSRTSSRGWTLAVEAAGRAAGVAISRDTSQQMFEGGRPQAAADHAAPEEGATLVPAAHRPQVRLAVAGAHHLRTVGGALHRASERISRSRGTARRGPARSHRRHGPAAWWSSGRPPLPWRRRRSTVIVDEVAPAARVVVALKFAALSSGDGERRTGGVRHRDRGRAHLTGTGRDAAERHAHRIEQHRRRDLRWPGSHGLHRRPPGWW